MHLTNLKPRIATLGESVRAPWAKAVPQHRLSGRALQRARMALFRANPLCVECHRRGRATLATIRDHIMPVAQGGSDDASNIQGLCDACHEAKTMAEGLSGRGRGPLSEEYEQRRMPRDLRPSAIPLTIVCGPPGSGKSAYVQQHAASSDIIIDLDAIVARMSGLPEHHTGAEWIRAGLDERNRQLHALATATHGKAWFIIACPKPSERQQWAAMLRAKVVLLDTPLSECERRIRQDRKRSHATERMISAARDWWDINERPAKTMPQLRTESCGMA